MKNGCIEDRERGFFFWFAGFIAASSIFIEQKRRRAELALYVISNNLTWLDLIDITTGLRIILQGSGQERTCP